MVATSGGWGGGLQSEAASCHYTQLQKKGRVI